MKRLMTILFVGMAGLISAQQTEQLTQYMFNQFGLNPAFAGIKECIDTRFGFRTQWMGLEGAPRTAYANINGRIFRKKGFHKHRHGFGGSILSDATGPTSRTFVNPAYAFHFPFSKKLTAAVGVSAGFLQYRFNRSYVTLADPGDNAVDNATSKFMVPDINMGLLLYNDRFYGGFTLKQVWRNDLSDIFSESRLTHHFYLNVGKKLKSGNEHISWVPSVLLKFTRLSVPSADINLMADFDQTIAFGLSFRNTDALAALVKVNFLKRFSFGYSFDLTTSDLRYGSSNTHEITLGFYSCPIRESDGYECPTF